MGVPNRFPTIIGIVLVLIFVIGFIFLFEQFIPKITKASLSIEPASVAVSNITETSFTLTWTTAELTTGLLTVSNPKQKTVSAYDQRDATGTIGKYTTHSVTAINLSPQTSYTIAIHSNGKKFQGGSLPQTVSTAPSIPVTPGRLEPAYGTILLPDNQPAVGALVYINLEGSQKLSALVKPSGSWLIPLNLARNLDLQTYLLPGDRLNETISVIWNDQEIHALTDTLNDAPVPTMIMGKAYDFRKQQAQKPPALVEQKQPGTEKKAVLGTQTKRSKPYEVAITAPLQGSALTTSLPLFQGTGIPDKSVSITIGITNPIGGSEIVNSDGIWKFTPPQQLAPGKQSVTITTTNALGKPVALTHTFDILKSGTQVLGEATPSATLTPTISLTPEPTSTSSGEDLTGQPIPTSGSTTPTIFLIFLSLILLSSGVFVFSYK